MHRGGLGGSFACVFVRIWGRLSYAAAARNGDDKETGAGFEDVTVGKYCKQLKTLGMDKFLIRFDSFTRE